MKKLAIILFFVPGLIMASNIRVIGNGGGEVEMIALSHFEEMPWIIQMCALENNPCRMPHKKWQIMHDLSDRLVSESLPKVLRFHAEGERYEFDLEKDLISISSQALNNEEVLAIVFEAYSHYLHGEPQAAIGAFLAGQNLDHYALRTPSGYLRLFQFTDEAHLYIEKPGFVLIDINEEIARAMACSMGQITRISDLSRLSGSSGWQARVRLSCGGKSLEAQITGQYEEGEDAWIIDAFRLREALASPACANTLAR